MMVVHGRATSGNVAKVMWALRELEVPHERVDIGGNFGGLTSDAYQALNPNGVIPTVVEDGFVLWESNAIVRYIAARYGAGSLWPDDPVYRADVDRWMDWSTSTLLPVLKDARDAAGRGAEDDIAFGKAGRVFAILDAALADRPYLAGDPLTMGDIALGGHVHRWFLLPQSVRPRLAHLQAYYDRLGERPAYVRSIVDVLR
ncbi:MAG: glutathione S-transferase family protein [Geminicoccaceae bacterium]